MIPITGLNAITSLDDADLLVTVDVSDGVLGTKKITLANMRSSIIRGALGTAASLTLTAGLTVSSGTTALQAVTCTTLAASGAVTVGPRLLATPSTFGYSGLNYKVALLGSTGTNYQTDAVTISLGADPLTVTGGSFVGNGSEILLRRGMRFIQQNAGGTDWEVAGLTIGAVTCTTLTASGNIVTTGLSVSSGLTFSAGSAGSGTGGNFRSISDDGVLKWITGILGTVGDRAFHVYDNANARDCLAFNGTTGAATFAAGITCTTLTASGSGVLGATALLASERLRVAGGTMGTPGATDVLMAAGAISCGAGISCTTLTASGSIVSNRATSLSSGVISAAAGDTNGLFIGMGARNANAGSAAYTQLQLDNDINTGASGTGRLYIGLNSSTNTGLAGANSAYFGSAAALGLISNNLVRMTLTGSTLANGTVSVLNTLASTSTTTGALTVAGGLGVAGRVSATEFASGTTKVLGAQGAAVADATDAATAITQLNALLARCRAHGLIA